MKSIRKLFLTILSLALLTTACSSVTESTESTSSDSLANKNVGNTEPVNNHAADFEVIKDAILSHDLTELKKHCNNEKMDAEMLIELFRDEDFSAQLSNGVYEDLTESEIDGTTYQQFSVYLEGSDDEGNVYESGIYLYFNFSGEHLVLDYYLAAG